MFGKWPNKITVYTFQAIKKQLFHNSVGTSTVLYGEK